VIRFGTGGGDGAAVGVPAFGGAGVVADIVCEY